MSNTNWSSDVEPPESQWQSNSGSDTDIPLYDDATISYDDPLIFYDGFDATTITTEDVNFSTYSADIGVNNATWTDAS